MAAFDFRGFDCDKGNECGFRNFNNFNSRDCNTRGKDKCCEKSKDCSPKGCNSDQRKLREECLIAFKVYDSCRQQDCLGECELGSARAAENICINGNHIKEGEIIDAPNEAASVIMDKLKIKKIIIMDKKLNEFKKGYWDIDIKYVFEYRLTFRESNGCVIGCVKANSIFDKSVLLFGSVGSEFVIGTDLLSIGKCGDSTTVDADPFTLVEAKSVLIKRLQIS